MKLEASGVWVLVHLAIAASATLAIVGHYQVGERRWIAFVFKPLATLLILALAALRPPRESTRYRSAIIAGLTLSLLGDIFLMLPGDRFLAGLSSFLLAHVCYLAAFTSGARFARRLMPFVALGCASGAVLMALWPRLPGNLKVPILVYAALLVAMTGQAVVRSLVRRREGTLLAAVGTLLFFTSDCLFAFNRFHTKFWLANVLVLVTYYVAQWLIAMSVSQVRERVSGEPFQRK